MATGIELILSTICNATFCDAIFDNPLSALDVQLSKTQLEIKTLSNEINGKHLKIATLDNYPLSFAEKGPNGTWVGRGVAFEIVDILKERYNFTFEVIVPERNYEVGGSKPEESIVGLVNSSLVDMAAVFLPKLLRFQSLVTFSTPLDEGIWMMMLKRPKESAAGSGLLAPFNNFVWYLILAAVITYGPCITLLTRIRSRLVRDKEPHLDISPSFWFVYSAFIKQGTNLAPEANTTRVLFATWWLFIILLSAFYTANLTAFLTLSKFTLDIETPEDLLKKNYRWVAPEGGSVQYSVKNPNDNLNYLSRMLLTGRAEFRSVNSDYDYLPMVRGGAVLVKEQTAIDYMMYGDYLAKTRDGIPETDRCTYVVAPKPFMHRLRAFAYPMGSKLQILFDHVLSYIFQAGIINFLEYRDLPDTKICPLDLQSKDRQLRNSDLLMTYLIMVTGLAAAIAVFIGEVFIKRYLRIKIKTGKSKKKRNKMNKRVNHDETRPPPYDSLFGRHSKLNINENSERKLVNGREYYLIDVGNGIKRLVPVRTPSAFLYQ